MTFQTDGDTAVDDVMEMLIEQAGDCPECGEGASDGTSWSITGQSTAQCPNGHEWDVDF